MIFVDTTFFLGMAFKKDQWHDDALKLIPLIEKNHKIVSNHILSESVTGLGAKVGRGAGKVAKNLYDYMVKNCQIVYVDQKLSDAAMLTYRKYDGTLSFADSVSIEVMTLHNVQEIVSFDDGFDKVDGILRIHTPS